MGYNYTMQGAEPLKCTFITVILQWAHSLHFRRPCFCGIWGKVYALIHRQILDNPYNISYIQKMYKVDSPKYVACYYYSSGNNNLFFL